MNVTHQQLPWSRTDRSNLSKGRELEEKDKIASVPMRERGDTVHIPECNGHALRTHRAQSMRKAELEKV